MVTATPVLDILILNMPESHEVLWDYCLENNICMPVDGCTSVYRTNVSHPSSSGCFSFRESRIPMPDRKFSHTSYGITDHGYWSLNADPYWVMSRSGAHPWAL